MKVMKSVIQVAMLIGMALQAPEINFFDFQKQQKSTMNYPQEIYSIETQAENPEATNKQLSSYKYDSKQMVTRNSIPEYGGSETDINIEDYLGEFKSIECADGSPEHNRGQFALCPDSIQHQIIEPLGESLADAKQLAAYVNDNVYAPLAIKPLQKVDINQILSDLSNTSKQTMISGGQPQVSNYNKFQETVEAIFKDIEGKASDVEANKSILNELNVALLKRFHMYWNQQRHLMQMDKAREDTLSIVEHLIRSYAMKKDFLNYVTQTLLKQISLAYYKFLRAHKTLEVFKEQGATIFHSFITTRYKQVASSIQKFKTDDILMIREVSQLIGLLQAYLIASYKQGISEVSIMKNYRTSISTIIEASYYNFKKSMEEKKDKFIIGKIREFTAILLLKFQLTIHTMMVKNSLTTYLSHTNIW